MKIGVSSYSFSKYIKEHKCSYNEVCDLAKELGFDGIEFVGLVNESWGLVGDPIEMAKGIREHCEKIGLPIVAYTVGANLVGEGADKVVEDLKRALDVAKELGAPVLRHDVCYKLAPSHLYTYEDAIEEMVPRIREVTDYAASLGIKTCTENHGYIFQEPERVLELIEAVNRENYGWLCDIGNFLCADADPAESVRIAAPHTFHVHAKDFLFKSADSAVMPSGYQITTVGGNFIRGTVVGHGVVPVAQCINIIKKAGYDGFVSIEFEGPEETLYALRAGLENLRRVVG